MNRKATGDGLIGVAALALPSAAIAEGESRLRLRTPQVVIAHQVYDLHTILLGLCIAIAAVAFGIMFCSIVRHRRVRGEAELFHASAMVEITWSVIPCLIVAGMAYPAVRTVVDRKQSRNLSSPVTWPEISTASAAPSRRGNGPLSYPIATNRLAAPRATPLMDRR